MVARTVK